MLNHTYMTPRPLGRTGFVVSSLALGTVSLGVPYGIPAPGARTPDRAEALELLRAARAAGITFYDTAPNYGTAEALLGEALGADETSILATKVSLPPAGTSGEELTASLGVSVEHSRRALRRDRLDVLQIHNLTVADLARPGLADALQALRDRGWVGALGASIYTEEEALAALASGWCDVLQVPYNLLDQRMRPRVFAAARAAGVAVLTRSAYLKGALTGKSAWLPPTMPALLAAVARLESQLPPDQADLTAAALRFCVHDPAITSVMVGPAKLAELDQTLAHAAGDLPTELRQRLEGCGCDNPAVTDPRCWPIP